MEQYNHQNYKKMHPISARVHFLLLLTKLRIKFIFHQNKEEQHGKAISKQYNTICRPLCGQTQAFWSADKRNGRGAVENRTA